MKRVMLGVSIALSFPTDGMMVLKGQSNAIQSSSESNCLQKIQETTLSQNKGSNQQVPEADRRIVEDINIVDDQVEILIQDYTYSDGQLTPLGRPYTKKGYPLDREVIRYDYVFGNNEDGKFAVLGYPIEELSVTINDIENPDKSGKIVLGKEIKNVRTPKVFTPYFHRTGEYEDNDAEHFSKAFTEVYIKEGKQKRVVSAAKVRKNARHIPYIKLDPSLKIVNTPVIRNGQTYYSVNITEKWQRPGREDSILEETKQERCLLKRNTLGYEHESNFSYPIEELFVQVKSKDVPEANSKVIIDEHFVNRAKPFIRFTQRTGQFENDDANLRATPYTRQYIIVDGQKQYINQPEIRKNERNIPYILKSTRKNKDGKPEKRKNGNSYQKFKKVEEWQRPDGSIFVKWSEMFEKVPKSTPQPARSPQRPWFENQRPPEREPRTLGDVVRNIFTLGGLF